jgi:putative ABC transport system ATP-binding protein
MVAATAPVHPPLIEGRGLTRVYPMGDSEVAALRGVDFRIELGENVAIIGPSGSGKSTLLHILGLLDRPTTGQYLFAGVDTDTLDDDRLALLRNRAIGFIFQSFNLVSGESALENVAAPLVYAGVKRKERAERAEEALARVGLSDRGHHDPSQLSGGQRQRVAIARALVTRPAVILADEPTGNLDSRSSADVFTLLQELQAEGLTLVTITHDQRIADRAARVLRVEDGMLVEPGAPGPTYLDGGGRPHEPTTAPATPLAGAVVVPPESGLAALGLVEPPFADEGAS